MKVQGDGSTIEVGIEEQRHCRIVGRVRYSGTCTIRAGPAKTRSRREIGPAAPNLAQLDWGNVATVFVLFMRGPKRVLSLCVCVLFCFREVRYRRVSWYELVKIKLRFVVTFTVLEMGE